MSKKTLLIIFVIILASVAGCNEDNKSSTATTNPTPTKTTFSIRGHVLVSENTAKDSDVNDPNAVYVSNDSLNTAQNIPNPVILGGYANQPNAGPLCGVGTNVACGRSHFSGDVSDFYFVDLNAKQIVTLFVAGNSNINDLDLYLYDINGKILDASILGNETEGLIVPINGRYFLEVRAQSGFSNYTLSIGQDLSTNAVLPPPLTAAFVPGEMIVQFKSPEILTAQNTLQQFNLQNDHSDFERRVLITLESSRMKIFANDHTLFITPEFALKYETLMTIKGLRQNHEIEEASPNYLFHALRVPNDTYYGYQWNYPLMNLPQAWDITMGDPNIIVAVVDTGVLLNHPDLQGKLVAGYDFIADRTVALDGDGIDANPNDPGDQNQGSPGSSSFHGTHVAGTIGAATNNGIGIASVGWQTKVMPLRVLGKGGAGTDYDIEQAVRFAAGLANDSRTTPARRADVINLSLGGASISSGFQRAVAEARAAGVIIVAAAGNDGTSTPMFPASLDGVVSVSAVDINKDRASYSNYGDAIDVAAPGGDNTPDVNGDGVPDGIVSTVGSEVVNNGRVTTIEYAFATSVGTSMASPHIAGVVALMKAANPRLTPQDFDNLLSSGKITEDLGSRGRDNHFGYGLINAQKAVSTAVELSSGVALQPSAELVVSPKSLNFGITGTIAILTASNGGRGTLSVQTIQDPSGFLTIREKSIDNNHLGDYTVTVNRAGLNPGTYTTAITVTSNVNTVKIPVILQVGNTNSKGDAGHHYILLVDAKTLDTLLEVRTTGNNGIYDFTFNNLNVGSYKIFAGTDFNNDGFICDSGEACGAFLTLARPSSVDITQESREGIEFGTGFNINFLSQQGLADETSIPNHGIARLQLVKNVVQ